MRRRQAALIAVVAMVSGQLTLGGTPAGAATGPGLPTVGPGLAAMARHQPAPAARASITATANDVTGDGLDDVLTRDRATGRLDVHAGRGALAGAATLATPVQVRATTPDRVWFGQGDLNGDGRNDVASVDGAGVMYAAFNQGVVAGAPQLSADTGFLQGFAPNMLPLLTDYVGSDPNNPLEPDGRADIVFRDSGAQSVYLYVNDGMVNGKPSYSNRGALLNGAGYLTDINLADLTGDYFKDIVITQTDGTMWALDIFAEVDSNGNPVAKWYKIIGSGMNSAGFVLFPDFNADEYPDFAARITASGEFRGVLHSRRWNAAQPETVFDASTGQLVQAGWARYDWIF
ncbi:VCBS repeat-containing protein [Amycolatopsis sp.]|uniref:FG-GAP repeat domain-containing protein n=1 Tax=Amycolatopsis sp. TaxID=37632 RepID=UPI002D805F74|nr:VCBS repeat-containing protein [Amycolatopsis sp.]HET6708564.1 VCBS repeat-containing protein [Amycolatopsis sp.]